MATDPRPDLPEEFENLSIDEKIEYVHLLWNHITDSTDEVPVPEWQRQLLHERLESRSPEEDIPWEEVKAGLEDE